MVTSTKPEVTDLNSLRSLVAANYLGTIGALTIVILPGIVGVITESLQLNPGQVGIVMSADIVTMALAMGVAAFLIHKWNWRVMAVIGLAFLLLGTVASIGANSFESMILARFIAGIGEGIAVSVAFAMFGGTRNPDREFGVYLVVILSVAATFLYFIPAILDMGGKSWVFALIAIIIVINFLTEAHQPAKTLICVICSPYEDEIHTGTGTFRMLHLSAPCMRRRDCRALDLRVVRQGGPWGEAAGRTVPFQ
jgi:MFS family permease